jgi:hypothetical protein
MDGADPTMSALEFQILCSAYYAVFELVLKIWAGSLAGAGVLAGVILGFVRSL